MNRRLFWKIFLSFWVTQIIFISYLGYKAHSLSRNPGPLWLATAEKTMPLVAKSVLEKYQAGGTPALRQELDQQSVPERLDFWLFDSAGNELSGRPVPPEVKNLYPRLRGNSSVQEIQHDDMSLLAIDINSGDSNYKLVAEYHTAYFLLAWVRSAAAGRHQLRDVVHNLPPARALPHAPYRRPASCYACPG